MKFAPAILLRGGSTAHTVSAKIAHQEDIDAGAVPTRLIGDCDVPAGARRSLIRSGVQKLEECAARFPKLHCPVVQPWLSPPEMRTMLAMMAAAAYASKKQTVPQGSEASAPGGGLPT